MILLHALLVWLLLAHLSLASTTTVVNITKWSSSSCSGTAQHLLVHFEPSICLGPYSILTYELYLEPVCSGSTTTMKVYTDSQCTQAFSLYASFSGSGCPGIGFTFACTAMPNSAIAQFAFYNGANCLTPGNPVGVGFVETNVCINNDDFSPAGSFAGTEGSIIISYNNALHEFNTTYFPNAPNCTLGGVTTFLSPSAECFALGSSLSTQLGGIQEATLTLAADVTLYPTQRPTTYPSKSPTNKPSSLTPTTLAPVPPSSSPSKQPTARPTVPTPLPTLQPTAFPTKPPPTLQPTSTTLQTNQPPVAPPTAPTLPTQTAVPLQLAIPIGASLGALVLLGAAGLFLMNRAHRLRMLRSSDDNINSIIPPGALQGDDGPRV